MPSHLARCTEAAMKRNSGIDTLI